jgi:uncharacterized protein (TIGR03086 family)
VRDLPPGATGLLAGAISYTLGVCALVGPHDMGLPTPCADWDLAMLLAHLSASMADLEAAISAGTLDLERPPDHAVGDPVEILRDRAAQLLCAAYGYDDPVRFVAVSGLPVPVGLVACTGAVEIAVHGWDVSAARGDAGRAGARPIEPIDPIPSALATRMLRLCPLLVAGREGLFAGPVEVPAQASPGDKLVAFLGRDPGTLARGPALVTGE